MLPKKKRWTAAIHGSMGACQSSAPVLLPSAALPTKGQRPPNTQVTSPGPRPLSALQSPPGPNNRPSSMANTHPNSGLPTVPTFSQSGATRLTSADLKTQTFPARYSSIAQNESSTSEPSSICRNDFQANLIAAIAQHPSDFFQQQPGLLLQILPQEYLTNLVKLANSGKNVNDLVGHGNSSQASDLGAKPMLSDQQPTQPLYLPNRASNSLTSPHRSESAEFQGGFHRASPSNLNSQPPAIKSKLIEPGKIAKPIVTMHTSPQVSTSTGIQCFSPHRRLSGSSDITTHHSTAQSKVWNQAPTPQHLAGLDFSTISAVARAASLFSSSRVDPATASALLSQWENAAQIALLSSHNRNMCTVPAEPVGRNQSSPNVYQTFTLPVSTSSALDSGYIDSQRMSQPDSRYRNHVDQSANIRRHTPSPSVPAVDIRRQSTSKPPVSAPRQTDISNRLPAAPPTSTIDLTKSYHVTPPWLPSEHRPEQTNFPRVCETAAILHDAKMAALSSDWPSSSSSSGSMGGNLQRVRSSSSFSSPLSPVSTTTSLSSFTSPSQQQQQQQQFSSPLLPGRLGDTKDSMCTLQGTELNVAPQTVKIPTNLPPAFASKMPPNHPYPPPCLTSSQVARFSQLSTIGNKLPSPPCSLPSTASAAAMSAHYGTSGENPVKSPALQPSPVPTGKINVTGMNNSFNPSVSLPWTSNRMNSVDSCPRTNMSTSLAPASYSLVGQVKSEANNSSKTVSSFVTCVSESRPRNSSMPLKKRLIQRYEADRDCTKPGLIQHGIVKTENGNTAALQFNLPSSPDGSESLSADAGKTKIEQNPVPVEDPIRIKENKPTDRNEGKQRKNSRVSPIGVMAFGDGSEKVAVSNPLKTSTASSRRGGFRGSRRFGAKPRITDPYKSRASKSRVGALKADASANESDSSKSSSAVGRRGRRNSSSASSVTSLLQGSERVEEHDESLPRCRMAAMNGALPMMVAAQVQRCTSPASSSSSLRSVGADEIEVDHEEADISKLSTGKFTSRTTEVEKNDHLDPSPDSPQSRSSTTSRTINTSERNRKSKRAAALAASAAATASAGGVKRPRTTTPRGQLSEPTRKQFKEQSEMESHDEEMADEGSISADDASSIMTTVTDSKSTGTAADELTAALAEDKLTLTELAHQLPGPPDLPRLTSSSLRPAHSLDYYKRNQTPFVQLVSCNDPGLKQVPKCRACRQLKGVILDTSMDSVNGDSSVSDEDSRESKSTVRSTPSNRDNQFKRPSGRNFSANSDKSRECVDKPKSRKNVISSPVSVFCRFWGFRKLTFNNRGILKIADFCHSTEATPADRSLWEMHDSVSPPLSVNAAKYILERAGMLFCRLLRQELSVLNSNRDKEVPLRRGPGAPPKNGLRRGAVTFRFDSSVAWKQPVKGVREMCDVCETTMFNTHWVCAKCGYSVCVHCCDEAKMKSTQVPGDSKIGSDELSREKSRTKQPRTRAGPAGWASCTTTRQHHDPERLLLTSLLPACTVGKLLHRVHRIARHYHIRLRCGCPPVEAVDHSVADSTPSEQKQANPMEETVGTNGNSLDLLADLALKTTAESTVAGSDKMKGVSHGAVKTEEDDDEVEDQMESDIENDISVLPPHTFIHKPTPTISPTQMQLTTEVTNSQHKTLNSSCQKSNKYRILQLYQADDANSISAFQHEWRQNRPVIVSGCHNKFNPSLWSPSSFAEDFGQLRTTLVDCATGVELTRYPLRTFWEGFERKTRRLVSKDGRAFCLKLKDWPTTDDFAELQPKRFADLMSNLPMPDYSGREGQLNLAARLSSFFVCPDLGPKLYVAYGTGGSRSMGTTNLHVDIADAINILLYVGHPSDSFEESSANAEAVLNVVRQAGVDRVFLERAMSWTKRMQSAAGGQRQPDENPQANQPDDVGPPGALWHIFLPGDMPALREFLTQVREEETGAPLEPGNDPIHDQLFYLDQPLLDRLYACTGVLPVTIVQFYGDAIFIPAGSAHQVRNLNSCIKAAVDFVSPEHLPQCFQLVEEFRRLSTTHQNREDKLQVKNMLYHGIKDALSVLLLNDPGRTVDVKPNTLASPQSMIKHEDQGIRESATEPAYLSTSSSVASRLLEDQDRSRGPYSIPHSSFKPLSSTRGKPKGRPGRPRTTSSNTAVNSSMPKSSIVNSGSTNSTNNNNNNKRSPQPSVSTPTSSTSSLRTSPADATVLSQQQSSYPHPPLNQLVSETVTVRGEGNGVGNAAPTPHKTIA
ncbi:unnamed protein product [Calicophoron daubneyi]|uniref:JmjC domain-containing protein n=1 Tax=Calicophoron daubneyi TaxID=300641 RepID=A0AAV2T9T4_CALDB